MIPTRLLRVADLRGSSMHDRRGVRRQEGSRDDRPPALRVLNMTKSFVEGQRVLDGVNFQIDQGTIHALVGANGSGKSTLVKILAGYHSPEPGCELHVGGAKLPVPTHPADLRRAGIRFVHQENRFVPAMSVLDNMCLGAYETGPTGRINWKREAQSLAEVLEELGIRVQLHAPMSSLPMATVAQLAVVRALRSYGSERLKLLVLDEPTTALGREDADLVTGWLRSVTRGSEVGALFISHRVSEVLAVADRVSVLRQGHVVLSEDPSRLTEDVLVEAIAGRRIQEYYPAKPRREVETELEVRDLSGGHVRGASFALHRGEILGITGLPGSGFEQVPYLLMDPKQLARGYCAIGGTPVTLGRTSIRDRIRMGMALLPADRAVNGLATDMSLRENVTLPRLRAFFRAGMMRLRQEERDSLGVVQRFGMQTSGIDTALSRLSGGNQQKVLLAKWIMTMPRVLLLHEPTQAVDVGARSDIFKELVAYTRGGSAILIASVEYEDLAHLCHRVLVFGSGEVRVQLSGTDLTAGNITAAAYRAGAA